MEVGPNTSLGTVRSSVGPPSLTRTTASPSTTSTVGSSTTTTTTTISPREQIKIEFYRTYDVMTGIRIAATLGGFFSLMVILIVYKSKSKTDEALKDPKLAAAAVAEAEEEEQRQIQAAVEATLFEQLHPNVPRRSLDVTSLPASWTRTRRFSSIGGYSSLLGRRSQFSSQLPSFDDEESAADEERTDFDDELTYNRGLEVPRRASNITCSSSGSSYLERRGSSIFLGLPVVPVQRSSNRRRQSSPVLEQSEFYYPIDIRVIQPTPRGSPCGSERTLYATAAPVREYTSRRAPLASISSCNTSLSADYPDFEMNSFYSDVFQDDSFIETEDEAENFSTDSDDKESERQEKREKAMRTWREKRRRFAEKRFTSSEKRGSIGEGGMKYDKHTTGRSFSIDYGQSASGFENKRKSFSKRRISLNDRPFGPSYRFLSIDRQPSLDERRITLFEKRPSLNDRNLSINSSSYIEGNSEIVVQETATSTKTPSVSDKATNVCESKLNAFICVNIAESPPSSNEEKVHSSSNSKDEIFLPSSTKEEPASTSSDKQELPPTCLTEISHERNVTNKQSSFSQPSSCKSSISVLSPMTSEESATVTLPTLPLRQRSSSSLEKRTSWSQETLF